ncbi:family 16 glycosylhydrolase [Pseudoalteromonas haloplanktis]|uniref:Family 16 glycosylhydrolase n=1 Tax=Pseudoalteromonas haloplanktis TaxID=228 RepID=A0ABU1B7K0_PSEHA|nr:MULTISPECIES: family 16 glycosylhydrolase [Pseudoalteromonas]MDQ9090340.1 family 16 glycosylhydrolase [Pseudoalteromonas haloplanktis]TMN74128.1 glycoside hydrolase [Pseudoalteromonas sp. S1727]
MKLVKGKIKKVLIHVITQVIFITHIAACGNTVATSSEQPINKLLPFSDPDNRGDWQLNTQVSDEFDAPILDEQRWYVVGKFEDGKPVYKHPDKPDKKVWKGRAPSQFSGRNYRLEDGKLILETRWEPDFPFETNIHIPVFGEALKYENITTACLIGRKSFQYGYIEIKSKAADAQVSSAFWAMGEQLEFDFYEQFGDARDPKKEHISRELWWSIRDWSKEVKGKPTYTEHKDLGFRVADDFHIYGIEWDATGVKYFIDGKLFSEVSVAQVDAWAKENRGVDKGYVATKPLFLWLDQETFPWHGVPQSKEDLELNSAVDEKDDGIVDFEIEYIRVWQKSADLVTDEGEIL